MADIKDLVRGAEEGGENYIPADIDTWFDGPTPEDFKRMVERQNAQSEEGKKAQKAVVEMDRVIRDKAKEIGAYKKEDVDSVLLSTTRGVIELDSRVKLSDLNEKYPNLASLLKFPGMIDSAEVSYISARTPADYDEGYFGAAFILAIDKDSEHVVELRADELMGRSWHGKLGRSGWKFDDREELRPGSYKTMRKGAEEAVDWVRELVADDKNTITYEERSPKDE